jgi:ribose 5-phosphate isomerase A
MPQDQSEKKRRAARAALELIQPDTIVGIGTGSTVNLLIEALGESQLRLRGAVSSSSVTSELLRAASINVLDLNVVDTLDLYIDGADEATRARCLIKGGGGALTGEKIVASVAQRFICIVDDAKIVARLGTFPLPIEVIPMARAAVTRRLLEWGGRAVWREGFVSDHRNHILDVHGLQIDDPCALEWEINQIPGVVTVGIFAIRSADVLVIAKQDGIEWVGRRTA